MFSLCRMTTYPVPHHRSPATPRRITLPKKVACLPTLDDILAEMRREVRALSAKMQDRSKNWACVASVLVVDYWWQKMASRYGVKQPNVSHPEAMLLSAATSELKIDCAAIAEIICKADQANAVFLLGKLHSQFLCSEYKSTNGIHYTPPALAKVLVDAAFTSQTLNEGMSICDPSCGGGALLYAAARKLLSAQKQPLSSAQLSHLAKRLHGYEKDVTGAWLAEVVLRFAFLPFIKPHSKPLVFNIQTCDTLTTISHKEKFDIILANPPYCRVRLSDRQRQNFSRSLHGHANLFGVFLDLSLRKLSATGSLAAIVPTSMLGGQYFKNLRATFRQETSLHQCDFVTLRKGVFCDVQQELMLATFRRNSSAKFSIVRALSLSDSDKTATTQSLGRVQLQGEISAPWFLPRTSAEAELVDALANMPTRLSDWGFTVNTGPMIWNRFKSHLRIDKQRSCFRLIWAENVAPGGKLDLSKTKKPWRYMYLSSSDQSSTLLSKEDCIIIQRTTSKEQRRRLVASFLSINALSSGKGVVVENHLNIIRVRPGKEPSVSMSAALAFFNSSTADLAFRCISGSVAVSAYELGCLPLPSVAQMQLIEDAIENESTQPQIDALCTKIYRSMK